MASSSHGFLANLLCYGYSVLIYDLAISQCHPTRHCSLPSYLGWAELSGLIPSLCPKSVTLWRFRASANTIIIEATTLPVQGAYSRFPNVYRREWSSYCHESSRPPSAFIMLRFGPISTEQLRTCRKSNSTDSCYTTAAELPVLGLDFIFASWARHRHSGNSRREARIG